MEINNKLITFIGFAIRANKYKTGINSVATLKRANIIITCKTMSVNSRKEALKLAKKLNCNCYVTCSKELSELTNKDNVKIIAITDKNLSSAIIDCSNGELKVLEQENING